METVLNSFPIQLLFRGIFPGGFFLLSFLVATEGWPRLASMMMEKDRPSLWLLLAIAVFAGVVVYTFFRSLPYPLIEWLFNSPCFRKRCCTLISKETRDQLIDHWTVSATDTGKMTRDEVIAKHNTSWNDYVHLQYASSLCIGFGALIGLCSLPQGRSVDPDPMLILMAFLLLASGFIGDWRRRAFMDAYLKEKKNCPSQTELFKPTLSYRKYSKLLASAFFTPPDT